MGIEVFLKRSFRWHVWQGLWYRWIVDREIGRMKGKQCIV